MSGKYRNKHGEKSYNLVNTDLVLGVGKYAPKKEIGHQFSDNHAYFVGGTVILGIAGGVIYLLSQVISNYQNYSAPYKQLAMFYNATLVEPIKTFPKVWHWLASTIGTTGAVFGIAAYGILMWLIYSVVIYGIAYLARDSTDGVPHPAMGIWLCFFPVVMVFWWWVLTLIYGLIF